jgi:hypothetical protein
MLRGPKDLGILTRDEEAFCAFHQETLVAVKRGDLRAHYEIARRARALVLHGDSAWHATYLRCGIQIGKDRTYLHRMVTVAQRIKTDEFDRTILLADARGFPVLWSDLVSTARLTTGARQLELMRRLDVRRADAVAREVDGAECIAKEA